MCGKEHDVNGALGVSDLAAERINRADLAENHYKESHLIFAGVWVSIPGN